MILQVIPSNLIYQYWDKIEPFFKDIVESSKVTEYTADQMKVYAINGSWVIIGIFNETDMQGVIALTFSNYPNYRVAFITAIGGRMISTIDGYEQLKNICKSYNASKIQGYARESVARLWHRLGFIDKAILVEKDI